MYHNLNVKVKTLRLLVEILGKHFRGLRIWQWFLKTGLKEKGKDWKMDLIKNKQLTIRRVKRRTESLWENSYNTYIQ